MTYRGLLPHENLSRAFGVCVFLFSVRCPVRTATTANSANEADGADGSHGSDGSDEAHGTDGAHGSDARNSDRAARVADSTDHDVPGAQNPQPVSVRNLQSTGMPAMNPIGSLGLGSYGAPSSASPAFPTSSGVATQPFKFPQSNLGVVNGNPYDPNSLSNPYGAGSPYKADGIMNPYSQYGSPYGNKSATNPYANEPPKLVDGKGTYLGELSANPYRADSTSNPYGQYGSPYSSKSINNPYGAGSPYSSDPIYAVPSKK